MLAVALLVDIQTARAADGIADQPRGLSILRGHAHNDYEHARPLLDALAQGFGSVEADIWLVNGQLLVAHDQADVKADHTLQALYLDPIRDRLQRNGGRIFPNEASFTLLIDVKSAAEPTYVALRELLQNYTNILTRFTVTGRQTNALTILLTGNRAVGLVSAESPRWVALDGRMADLESNMPVALMPLISENWTHHFKWRGTGPFPGVEQSKLRQMVERLRASQETGQ